MVSSVGYYRSTGFAIRI